MYLINTIDLYRRRRSVSRYQELTLYSTVTVRARCSRARNYIQSVTKSHQNICGCRHIYANTYKHRRCGSSSRPYNRRTKEFSTGLTRKDVLQKINYKITR